ncbi:hypothetical protein ABR737_17400 [Streptomyces sp. Edi2]|uniref:hypothetical protein n=1 Tax=Streptomyces sp. Edi2 TaxID=3162528 RepID=UPI0033059D22
MTELTELSAGIAGARRSAPGTGPEEERAEQISPIAGGEAESEPIAAGPRCRPAAEFSGMTSGSAAAGGQPPRLPAEFGDRRIHDDRRFHGDRRVPRVGDRCAYDVAHGAVHRFPHVFLSDFNQSNWRAL